MMASMQAQSQDSAQSEQPGCPRCIGLEAKYNTAHTERGYWKQMHAKAVERETRLQAEVADLKAKLRLREDQLFGRKSEKASGKTQAEPRRDVEEPETKRKPGRRPGSTGYG